MSDGAPVWLKIMEHGAAGEARTKAFLLDRFWVLERSVDIDGADYLIQPRSLVQRFTDRTPPVIGVVQAKSFQDRKTTHHIPSRYVLDGNGETLKGFFAVLHLGREDDAAMYLLSSAEIAATLDRTDDEKRAFIIGAKALAETFQVTSRRQALDRIAHALAARSPMESFRFLDRVNIPFRKVSEQDIDYAYTLPIPNSQANIPKTYLEYRDKLRSLIFDMEEALVSIDTIMQTPNPRTALAELEKLNEHRAGSGYRDGLTLTGYKCDLDWSYLPEALDEHDRRRQALDAVGRLTAYVDLSHAVKTHLAKQAKRFDAEATDRHYLWTGLYYDLTTLALDRISVKLIDQKTRSSKAVLTSSTWLNGITARRSMADASDHLWHDLMTKVLERVCPELLDEDEA